MWPEMEPRSPGSLVNTLSTGPIINNNNDKAKNANVGYVVIKQLIT